jgi:RNA recognition motif-containing protein
VHNLNDTISIAEVKRQLYCLCSSVAPVVEIEMKKGLKTRGQAWISFASIEAASAVMSRLQGFVFLGKEMVIEFARSRSKSLMEYSDTRRGETQVAAVIPVEPERVVEEAQSRVLKVTGYPPRANEVVLGILFRQCKGFEKVQMKGEFALAFYATPENAAEAMGHLQGFVVVPGSGYTLNVELAIGVEDT